ncbi:unnamed protein product [Rhodiola kirilowii]
MAKFKFLLFSLLVLAVAHQTHAVVFEVTDTTGNLIFEEIIGLQYTLQEMAIATNFIFDVFRYTETDRKDVPKISLFIDNYQGVAFENDNNEIHFSSNYISSYKGNIAREFTGLLYSELALVWQWDTRERYTTAGWMVQGIADFVRLKAGYGHQTWAKPGQGTRWDQSADVTARFLDYCNDIRHDFVAQLNRLMSDGYSDDYFVQLLKKPINQVWREYKAAYGG